MTHTALVTREEDQWLADITDVQGAHTCSETGLAALDHYVREVTALMLDLPDGAEPSLEFEWVFEVSDADMTAALGPGWSLAGVAETLNVPVERVAHVPPLARAAR